MPRLPIDYSKTIMYKLVCNDLKITECYVGHTTEFNKRKCCHKTSCNNEKNKNYHEKKYIVIRDNGGWDNWSMIMIEEYNCKNKQEALKRERELYESLEATLNMIRPIVSNEEKVERQKLTKHNNYPIYREEILKKNKKWYENNKDKILENRKKWYENNKDKVIEQNKIKDCCPLCNKEMRKDSIKRHLGVCKATYKK